MAAEEEKSSPLYFAFVVTLVVVSLPIKNLAYLAPPLYVGIRWLQRDSGLIRRVSALVAMLSVVSAFALLPDHLAGRDISMPAFGFALLTYGSLFVLLGHRLVDEFDQHTLTRMVTACSWFIIMQALIGFLQFFGTGNPDAVCGTYGLLDGFRSDGITIGQVYYTFTLFCMMLFIMIKPRGVLSVAALSLGGIACVLAQSGHQTIFFVVALAGCSVVRMSSVRAIVRSLAACGL